VQKYISHFGGDPSNVTIAGQSAGGWSALSHLVSNTCLAQRGIIMSSPVFSFSRVDEAQDKFDRLIAKIGMSPSASGAEKVYALRNLTEKQMIDLINGEILIRPVWDSKWFGRQENPTRLDEIIEYPEWIQSLVMGWVKDETALSLPLWNNWNSDQLLGAVSCAVTDPQMAHDIQAAYDLSDGSRGSISKGVLRFSADALYVVMPLKLARSLKLPVSLYRFDQVDTCESSVFRNHAYHCLDLTYLFRMPIVTDSESSKSMQDLADKLSETFTDFVHGEQPWRIFGTAPEKVMMFNGSESKLVDWTENDERSRQFMHTSESQNSFIDAGYRLITYAG
jgi:carboxylesterase type B